MKYRAWRVYLLLWVVLAAAVAAGSLLPNSTPVTAPAPRETHTAAVPQAEPEPEELRGVWVPYFSLVGESYTENAFCENFSQMVETACANGMNALFVHVRPFCDALYPSQMFPWSHVVTGTQGQDPGYDPLAFMVETAHEAGLQFHAWVNPLRVKTGESTFLLAEENPYTQLSEANPYYFMQADGGIYLNPAYPYVRTLIADGVREIVEHYEVDGIHFDDYFYPAEDATLDEEAYDLYTQSVSNPLPLLSWRKANVNALVQEVYQTVKAADEQVVFGISPQGNLQNDAAMGADVPTWCAVPGYVDYLCPQLYYSFDHPTLGYEEALAQWVALPRHEGLRLYVGLALYKAGTDADGGTWQNADDILKRQSEQAKARQCAGVVLYAIDNLEGE